MSDSKSPSATASRNHVTIKLRCCRNDDVDIPKSSSSLRICFHASLSSVVRDSILWIEIKEPSRLPSRISRRSWVSFFSTRAWEELHVKYQQQSASIEEAMFPEAIYLPDQARVKRRQHSGRIRQPAPQLRYVFQAPSHSVPCPLALRPETVVLLQEFLQIIEHGLASAR